jgi:hypothetical protein
LCFTVTGGFAYVFLAKDDYNNSVAIKLFITNSKEKMKAAQAEIELMVAISSSCARVTEH